MLTKHLLYQLSYTGTFIQYVNYLAGQFQINILNILILAGLEPATSGTNVPALSPPELQNQMVAEVGFEPTTSRL